MSIASDKARELLLGQRRVAFRLEFEGMDFGDRRVVFDTFQNYAKITGSKPLTKQQVPDGCTLYKHGIHTILTHEVAAVRLHRSSTTAQIKNAESAQLRNRWTIAHELGHIYLAHAQDGEAEEKQAHAFASELLMPAPILLELRKRLSRGLAASELSRLFGVSNSAANNRLEYLQRREFFSATLHKEITEKYRELIDNYVYSSNSRQT
ncbi:MAG: ImmA/IrrE family metallo-endopeptidase [Oscillospiraceae bacterium]|nr:ImmA/IrrE family metallo-endopeptidase [Oscillospiraceae bacterium]